MLEKSERFEPYPNIDELAEKAGQILSLCNTMGEGWLLTAEMCDLIETGTPNIVCAQPFACLPNHVVGKQIPAGTGLSAYSDVELTYHGTKIDGPTSDRAKVLPDWAPQSLKDIEEKLPKQRLYAGGLGLPRNSSVLVWVIVNSQRLIS